MVDREVDGPVWVVLTRSLGLCWQSLAALGAYLGGLGPLLEPMLAVLGRSWRLCWRSWAALGAYVGGPGPSWAEKWPWPEREGDLASGSRPKSGPNPSGKAIRLGIRVLLASQSPEARYGFFL